MRRAPAAGYWPASSSIATTSRPWYDPQFGHSRCGITGSLHFGQYWTCTGVTWWWLRRCPFLDFEVRRFGTAMAVLAALPGSRGKGLC